MMRNRTALEIQTDIYKIAKETFAGGEEGELGGLPFFHHGGVDIPEGSEPVVYAVVRFTAGVAGQVSRGVVTVLIFVRDLHGGDGRLMDFKAVARVERLASEWVGSTLQQSPMGYRFELNETIQTMRDESRPYHFVSIPLRYEILEIN